MWQKIRTTTHPLNAPVSKTAAKQTGQALQDNNAPVGKTTEAAVNNQDNGNIPTHPLNAPVGNINKSAEKQAESSFQKILQASL